MEHPEFCTACRAVVLPSYNFCPTCGAKLKEESITTSKQIGIYLLSALLPPMGLFPGIRYLKSANPSTRHIGLIAIFLTILATIISIWAYFGFISQINKSLNQQINSSQFGY